MYQVRISYNWRDGKERECQEFLANKLAPGLAQLGFQFQDVQYTIWGNSPQIVGNGVVDTLSKAHEIFHSTAWQNLVAGISPLTDDFEVRLIRSDHTHSDNTEMRM